MKMSYSFVALSMMALLLSGCASPPDHCANWWYYWKDESVVTDMDKVKYLWEEPTRTVGISSPHKSQTLVGLSDLILNPVTFTITRSNKNNPLITVTVISPRDGGIDGAAEVISHEFNHIWVYQQWSAKIGETGIVAGRQHTDGDAIPDVVETNRAAGSIGQIYEFSHTDPDTFDMQSIGGWGGYRDYGDNEILARVEGITNPRARQPDKDWSKGGKQWRH